MFPTPLKDNKQIMAHPMNSPSDRNHINRSTQLPYFRRFPNSKFLSQERKRIEKYDIRDLSHQITSPQNRQVHRPTFFSKDRLKNIDISPKRNDQEKAASSILKPARESKKRSKANHNTELFKISTEK